MEIFLGSARMKKRRWKQKIKMGYSKKLVNDGVFNPPSSNFHPFCTTIFFFLRKQKAIYPWWLIHSNLSSFFILIEWFKRNLLLNSRTWINFHHFLPHFIRNVDNFWQTYAQILILLVLKRECGWDVAVYRRRGCRGVLEAVGIALNNFSSRSNRASSLQTISCLENSVQPQTKTENFPRILQAFRHLWGKPPVSSSSSSAAAMEP